MIDKLDTHNLEYREGIITDKINQLIDYLSDKEDPEKIVKSYNDLLDRQHEGEASKGECKRFSAGDVPNYSSPSSLAPSPSHPPQQEECKHTKKYSVGHNDWKCDDWGEPQLKEESPKEDELSKVHKLAYEAYLTNQSINNTGDYDADMSRARVSSILDQIMRATL